MKIDLLKTTIAILICALLAYASYETCRVESARWIISIGSFITLSIPFTLALGVLAKKERSLVLLSVLSWIMFAVEIVVNFCFILVDFSIPAYVVVNGLLFLLYMLVYSFIFRTRV